MPRLTVDLAEAQPREALPDGVYECKVFAISEVRRGDKSQYVEIQFTVQEGEFEGRKIWRNTPITGKGAGIFAEMYQKLTGEDIEFGPGKELAIDTEELIGLPLAVATKQREYPEGSGEFQTEVKKVLRSEHVDF